MAKLEEEISQKKFKNEYHKAHINLMYTANWAHSYSKAFFAQFNLTSQQFNILRILRGQSPEPANISLLKDRMIDKMCDASRLVDRLKQKKLIVKKVSKEDKRAACIYISQEGMDLLEQIDKKMDRLENVMKNLTEKEVKELNVLLDKIRD